MKVRTPRKAAALSLEPMPPGQGATRPLQTDIALRSNSEVPEMDTIGASAVPMLSCAAGAKNSAVDGAACIDEQIDDDERYFTAEWRQHVMELYEQALALAVPRAAHAEHVTSTLKIYGFATAGGSVMSNDFDGLYLARPGSDVGPSEKA